MTPPLRILVTGGGRGLGAALVAAALERGHRVAATVRHPDATPPPGAGADRLSLIRLDVADPDAIPVAVGEAVSALGGLDVVINNAGVNAMSHPDARGTLAIDTLTAAPMAGILAVNLIAPLLVVRAALPALRAADAPRVLNISSWLGSIARAGNGNYAYASSKAALNMATRLLANELRDEGVVAVAVNPGWMRTSMGGQRAELSPQESAAGIVRLAETAGPQASGRFLQWDGTEHPW